MSTYETTTYPTDTRRYYARFDNLPTATLLHLLGQVRECIRESEHLNLEFADGVLGAVALYLRDGDEAARGAAQDAPDARLDVSESGGHDGTVGLDALGRIERWLAAVDTQLADLEQQLASLPKVGRSA